MLKRWLVFLTAFLSICPPTNCQAHKAQQGQASQRPTLPVASATVRQNNSPSLQAKPDQHVQADVRVIRAPAKDGYDIAAFWISALLAGVGIAGIGVGVWTICYVRRQAVEMRQQRIIMRRTLNAIRRQTKAAEDAAKAGMESANAALGSVKLTEAQLNLTKEKERARISITAGGLQVQEPDTEFWSLATSIEVRNLGPTRAIIQRTSGEFVIRAEGEELAHGADWLAGGSLSLPDDFIDPCTTPVIAPLHWFHWEPASLKSLADDLHGNKRTLHLYGFIEYETLGMVLTEEFNCFWMAGSVAAAFFRGENKNPTDAERVEDGNWWNNRDYGNGDEQD